MTAAPFDRFDPTDPDAYRALARAWAASVTVVTVRRRADTVGEGRPRLDGFTATAFLTVSIEPPIVLVSASNSGSAAAMLRDAECFAVSLLSSQQTAISEAFATPHDHRTEAWDLDGAPADDDGAPLFAGALGAFSARPRQFVDAGDHTLVLGDVTALRLSPREADALVYTRRAYGVVRPE